MTCRLVVVAACLVGTWPLSAHPDLQNNIQVIITAQTITLTLEVSLREIMLAQGLREDTQGGLDLEAISSAAKIHQTYVRDHLEVMVHDRVLSGAVTRTNAPAAFTSADRSKYMFLIRYPLGGSAPPEEIALHQTMLKEFTHGSAHPWHVDYIIHSKAGDGKTELASLAPGQTTKLRTGLTSAPALPVATTPTSQPQKSPGFFLMKNLSLVLAAAFSLLWLLLSGRARWFR